MMGILVWAGCFSFQGDYDYTPETSISSAPLPTPPTCSDAYEPNNTMDGAPFLLSQADGASLVVDAVMANDEDWYGARVPLRGELSVDVRADGEVEVVLVDLDTSTTVQTVRVASETGFFRWVNPGDRVVSVAIGVLPTASETEPCSRYTLEAGVSVLPLVCQPDALEGLETTWVQQGVGDTIWFLDLTLETGDTDTFAFEGFAEFGRVWLEGIPEEAIVSSGPMIINGLVTERYTPNVPAFLELGPLNVCLEYDLIAEFTSCSDVDVREPNDTLATAAFLNGDPELSVTMADTDWLYVPAGNSSLRFERLTVLTDLGSLVAHEYDADGVWQRVHQVGSTISSQGPLYLEVVWDGPTCMPIRYQLTDLP